MLREHLELRVDHRGGLADPAYELCGRRLVHLHAMGVRHLHDEGRELPTLLGGAVHDGLLPDLRDRLVEPRALGEALGHEAQDAREVGVRKVGDDRLRYGLGQLVGTVDHDQPKGVAHGKRVEGGDDVLRLEVGRGDPLVKVEGREALVQPALEARHGLRALEVVGPNHKIAGEQTACRLCHASSFP